MSSNKNDILITLNDLKGLLIYGNESVLRIYPSKMTNPQFISFIIPDEILAHKGGKFWEQIFRGNSKSDYVYINRFMYGKTSYAFKEEMYSVLNDNISAIRKIETTLFTLFSEQYGDLNRLCKWIKNNKNFTATNVTSKWYSYGTSNNITPEKILTFLVLYSIVDKYAVKLYDTYESYCKAVNGIKTDKIEEDIKRHVETWMNSHIYLDSKINTLEITNLLITYATYCYRRNEYICSFVIGNEQRKVMELYQPLSLYVPDLSKEYTRVDNIEFLEDYQRVLLVDSAGMGKTTFLKYLCLKTLVSSTINYIPFIINLRELATQDIMTYINKKLISISININISTLNNFIHNGGFLFLLDGYDESEDIYKKEISENINKLVYTATRNLFLLTSREEISLKSFECFKRLKIKNFEMIDAKKLLQSLDVHNDLSKYIVQRLEGDDDNIKNIKSLLVNPLLITLLYQTFILNGENTDIPYKKSDFYNHIFIALFQKHDSSKEPNYKHKKKSGLDSIDDFYTILRRFSFLCLEKQKLEYDLIEILNLLDRAIDETPAIKTNKNGYLDDLLLSVPFLEDNNFKIKWIHSSFRDYFASAFICLDTIKPYTSEIFDLLKENVAKYYDIFDFCYDLNPQIFQEYILLPFLNNYLDNYFNDKNLNVDESDLDLRNSLLLQYSFSVSGVPNTLSEMETIQKLWKNGKSPSLYKFFKDQNIVVFGKKKSDNIFLLLRLFKEKKFDIFYTTLNYDYTLKSLNDINEGTFICDSRINNPLNAKNNFISINSMFLDLVGKRFYMLNFQKCRRYCNEML